MAHLCRALRVQPGKAKALLQEIKDAQACQVRFDDESVSIICDRMTREAKDYDKYLSSRKAAGSAGGKATARARAKAHAVAHAAPRATAELQESKATTKATNKDLLKTRQKPDPTLDEIKAFCSKNKIPEQRAIDFYDYYQGNNLWTNKLGKPVNWWHIIRTDKWKNDQKRTTNYNRSVRQPDRNEGTANSGQADQYEGLGQVV